AFAGIFASGPKDIPAGMSWVNAMDSSSSTFYILRGGPRLILELNLHSQRWIAMLFTGMAVMFMYIVGQALRGKLKNRQKELLPPWQQWLMAVLGAAMVLFLLWYGVGNLMKKQVLDFDPAADTVQLDGDYLGPFRQVTGFRSYTTRGSKGSINYHLVMDVAGAPERQIGGANPHADVGPLADALNHYLAEVRGPGQ
ncbi:MAG TPA: hypothetical protein VGH71_02315, partial [Gammaproteobacteria bacterium]